MVLKKESHKYARLDPNRITSNKKHTQSLKCSQIGLMKDLMKLQSNGNQKKEIWINQYKKWIHISLVKMKERQLIMH